MELHWLDYSCRILWKKINWQTITRESSTIVDAKCTSIQRPQAWGLVDTCRAQLHKVAVPYSEMTSLAPSLKKYSDALANPNPSNNRSSLVALLQTSCEEEVVFIHSFVIVSSKSGHFVYVIDTQFLHVLFSPPRKKDPMNLNSMMCQGNFTSTETMDCSQLATWLSSSPTRDNGSTFSCQQLQCISKICFQIFTIHCNYAPHWGSKI